jgi:hypothetical protein
MGIYRGTGTSSNGIPTPDVSTRVALAGDTMTGYLNVPAGATGTQVPQRGEIDTALNLKATITTLAATGGAVLIGNTPSGNIVATTVQAALNELDTEKANLSGSASQAFSASTFTGSLSGNATTATDTVSKTGTGSTYVTNTSPTLITPNINSAQFATVSGTAPIYACRAWVNFNGTGTVAIRASGNVSSITDGGVGNYTVNFTTAMPDTNYSIVTGISESGVGGAARCAVGDGLTVSNALVLGFNTVTLTDYGFIDVVVFR